MNPYNFSLLLFAFGSFFIGLLVWLKRQDAIGKVYFIFSALTAVWGMGFAWMTNDHTSYETALFSARLADAAALLIPVTWLHLTLLVSDRIQRHKHLLIGLYFFSGLYFCFAFSPLFVSKIKPIMNFKYWLHPGPIFHIFPFMFFIVVAYGYSHLLAKVKSAQGGEKVQLTGFFVATLIGFIGGGLSFAPNYDIEIPQYGIFLMPVYPFATAYFMIRHRLLDVEQIAQAFQKEKLATIGLLAASINHEIKNPLFVARGLLENYLENKKEGLASKDVDLISGKALKQIERALEVIRKLNYFAKPSTDRTEGQTASIPQAIQTVLDLVSYEFGLDRIKIKNDLDPQIPKIRADQRQLEEILFNLIVNACHAMKEKGGVLTISSSCHPERSEGSTTIDPSSPATKHRRAPQDDTGGLRMTRTGKVNITIQDTGSGIPEDQLKYIFEPFRTTKGEKGMGLGLYITKQLVERNGGRISIRTKEGEGSTFELEFRMSTDL